MSEETSKSGTQKPLEGDDAIAKVRALLQHFRSAMFVTNQVQARALRVRPMGLQGDGASFGGTLWFFADDRSSKMDEIASDPATAVLMQNDEQNAYLHLAGRASRVTDRARMRELFTPLVKIWFPDGPDDPHLTLIRFDAESGSYWDSPGGMLRLLGSFTKAMVTGAPGKGGNTGTLSLP